MFHEYGKGMTCVESATPVTLIGAGPVSDADLSWALERAPTLVAADGGAATALAANLMPLRVIGDMDSLEAEVARSIPRDRLTHVAEQDSTDFEKCLSRIDAPLVIGLGFLGGRLDHTLAALACIVRREARCVLVGPEDVAFAAPRHLALDLPAGTRFSLFPFAPVTGRSEGLEWPIGGIPFSPGGRIGTSNRVTGPVRVMFDGPGMAILLPVACADAVLTAITGDPPVSG